MHIAKVTERSPQIEVIDEFVYEDGWKSVFLVAVCAVACIARLYLFHLAFDGQFSVVAEDLASSFVGKGSIGD